MEMGRKTLKGRFATKESVYVLRYVFFRDQYNIGESERPYDEQKFALLRRYCVVGRAERHL